MRDTFGFMHDSDFSEFWSGFRCDDCIEKAKRDGSNWGAAPKGSVTHCVTLLVPSSGADFREVFQELAALDCIEKAKRENGKGGKAPNEVSRNA